jgi:uncharacterized damage-inducible protein DinB
MRFSLESALLETSRTRLLDDYPAQIAECLAALTPEDIWWRPHEQSNAIGNILLHLAGSNRYWIGYGVGARAVERNRPGEFAARDASEVLTVWADSLALCRDVLGSLEPRHLVETTSRTGTPMTVAAILLHASHHVATHMGQIVWITKARRPGSVIEVWIRTRDRLAAAHTP